MNERARKAAPGPRDLEREAKAKVTYNPDGSWVAEVPREHIKRGVAMMEGSRRIKLDRDRERGAQRARDYVKVVRPDGKVVSISPDTVDGLKDKKHLRPVGRGGNSDVRHFGLSESFGKYEQGPEGLWFVWNDGWEPTSLFGGDKREGSQPDPDGNVWVRVDSEWVLESEVA